MYGVEIQANAIHALLEGDYKEEPGAGIQLAVLFLVLAAAARGLRAAGWQGEGQCGWQALSHM